MQKYKVWLKGNSQLKENLKNHSAVALLGPRQTGKTTLARMIAKKTPSVYLDLESPEDLLKLSDPLLYRAGAYNETFKNHCLPPLLIKDSYSNIY